MDVKTPDCIIGYIPSEAHEYRLCGRLKFLLEIFTPNTDFSRMASEFRKDITMRKRGSEPVQGI